MRRVMVAWLAAMALTAAFALPASGQTARDAALADAKTKAHNAIARRTTAIDAVDARLQTIKAVTPDHRTTLTNDLTAVKSGLTDLDGKIQAATTLAEVRNLAPHIVSDYYVFAFQLPRVRLVVAADEIVAVAVRATDIADRLQRRVDAAKTAGKDTGDAQAALDDMRAKVKAASDAAFKGGDNALSQKVTGFPGNHQALVDDRAQLVTARSDLAAARADAAKVLTILRALKAD